ncbi:hypothetical protein ACIBBE_04350, partial [Streptomyces sp. NPDC051644]
DHGGDHGGDQGGDHGGDHQGGGGGGGKEGAGHHGGKGREHLAETGTKTELAVMAGSALLLTLGGSAIVVMSRRRLRPTI